MAKKAKNKDIVTTDDLEKFETQFRNWADQLAIIRESMERMGLKAVENPPSFKSFKLGIYSIGNFLGKLQSYIFSVRE